MAAGDLCAVQTVKKLLLEAPGVTTDEGILQEIVSAVSQQFKTDTSRDLIQASYVEPRIGAGTRMIVLRQYPITAVASVVLGPPGAQTTLTQGVDWIFSQWSIRRLWGVFPEGSLVTISYTAGYATLPTDLTLAAAKGAAYRYKQLQRLGQNSKMMGQETVQFETANWTKDIQDVIDNYKRRSPIPQ